MREKGYYIEGIILKRKNFGEADKLLTIFSKEKGKIICLAKGVRKINSKRAPTLELFNQIKAYLVKGKSFDILVEVELLYNFNHLAKQLENIFKAYYLGELVDKFSAQNQRNLSLYHLLLSIFKKTEKTQILNNKLIYYFQKEMLKILGFGLPSVYSKEDLNDYLERILEQRLQSRSYWKKFCRSNF